MLWDYFRVTRRMKNYGLASQWFFAWIPEDENEVAFIFEDDVEVLESAIRRNGLLRMNKST